MTSIRSTDAEVDDRVAPTLTGRARRPLRRMLAAAVYGAAALLIAAGVAFLVLVTSLGRVEGMFDDLPRRPVEHAPQAVDVLVVSTDLVSVVHVDGDRRRVSMIWLPPGTEPTVAAVEDATGLRIDHYAAVDWSLFARLEPTAGQFWPPYEPADDVAETARRQEDYVRVIVGGNIHQEMVRNPVILYRFLHAVATHATVDQEWSIPDIARLGTSLHGIRSWDIQYLSAPAGDAAAAFWAAVARDEIDELGSLTAPEPEATTNDG